MRDSSVSARQVEHGYVVDKRDEPWLQQQLSSAKADLKAGRDERLSLKHELSRAHAKLGSRDKKIVRLKTIANYLLSTVTSEHFDGLKKELADLVKTKVHTPRRPAARLYSRHGYKSALCRGHDRDVYGGWMDG